MAIRTEQIFDPYPRDPLNSAFSQSLVSGAGTDGTTNQQRQESRGTKRDPMGLRGADHPDDLQTAIDARESLARTIRYLDQAADFAHRHPNTPIFAECSLSAADEGGVRFSVDFDLIRDIIGQQRSAMCKEARRFGHGPQRSARAAIAGWKP